MVEDISKFHESFIKSYNEESDDGYLSVRKRKSEFENYKNV